MKVLLDTNILLRMGEPSHPHHAATKTALRDLAAAQHSFCISTQTVSEFLAVATRPIADRGLGMSSSAADTLLFRLISKLEMLYEGKAAVDELRRLVVLHNVSGKSVHDTKLVATMTMNSVDHLLTLNSRDFARFKNIRILDPQSFALP